MNWLRQLLSRRRPNSDLSREIQEHFAEKTDELMAGGMSREEATCAPRREFGKCDLRITASSEARAVAALCERRRKRLSETAATTPVVTVFCNPK
jgi:uncharacterized protein YoaH (UPF0181 family)